MSLDRARALRQLAVSYVLTNALVVALSRPFARLAHLDEAIGAVFLVATIVSIRRDDDDTARYGVSLGGVFPGARGDDRSLVRAVWEAIPLAARELLVAAAGAAVVLPIYVLLWPRFNQAIGPRAAAFDRARAVQIVTEVLAIALTEEMYFRGYVQTRIADAMGLARDATVRANLRAMAPVIVLTAALFTLTHLVVIVSLPRALVFFPALLFGALRVRRGGIGAAVFLHAAFNVFETWLEGR